MATNNDDISSWKNLPTDLLELLRHVQGGAFPYPKRESDWAQMQDYLQNGNHSMATFKLEQMLTHQDSLRQGIPADLLQLIQAVQAGAIEYPNRESDWAQMQDYLQNGNHSMATFKLEQILVHQNNLRG